MSTYVYLECLDHDPPLCAEGESGQHLCDLPEIRKMIAGRESIVKWMGQDMPISFDSHFANNTAWFLYKHQKCRIGIVDEYDRRYSVEEEATV
jgi:hypothetical protein